MGGTSSRGGRSFAAMNEEQALTPTTPRREVAQPPCMLPSDSSNHSQSDVKTEDQSCSSVFDGEY